MTTRPEMSQEEIDAHLAWMPTKEENDEMWAEFSRLEAIEEAKLKAQLLRVKELRGAKFHALMLQWLQFFRDAGECHGWALTLNAPHKSIKPQVIDELPRNSYLQHEYVDQYRNGGMEGDSFAGQVWIHIKGRTWFTMHYSM